MLASYQPTQPEIVRCHQKDESSIESISTHLQDLLYSLFGPSSALRWRREVRVLAYVSYLLTTTGGARQTLGEEYANLVLVDPSTRDMPGLLKRSLLACLQAGLPYGASALRTRLLRAQASEEEQEEDVERWDASAMATRELLDLLLRILPALHLALFYLSGTFYHAAKRMVGVRYLRTVPNGATDSLARRLYPLAGALLLLQTCWRLGVELRAVKAKIARERQRRHNKFSSRPTECVRSRCPLCLERKKIPTAAPCGHTFCWDCIANAVVLQNEAFCPMCRVPSPLHRIVPLLNFCDEG